MPEDIKYSDFDAMEVPLAGSNLIEASAGTGKTYSIAIMALRMLLEKEIAIEEMLMVTFTKAAVAELKERIWKFVREAHKCSKGEEISNPQIQTIVERAMQKVGEEKVTKWLKTAVVNLDETAVMTIHSFCQHSLNEFAFETGQLFDAELLEDTSFLLEKEVRKFWRTQVTTIQVDLLKGLISAGLSQESILAILKNHLSGKRYIFFEKDKEYNFNAGTETSFLEKMTTVKDEFEQKQNALVHDVERNERRLSDQCASNRHAKKSLKAHLNDPEIFLEELYKKRDKQYAQKLFPDLLEEIEAMKDAEGRYKEQGEQCINYLYAFAIQEIVRGIKIFKITHNLMSFDDMISRMDDALKSDRSEDFSKKLRGKFKAVFIDEFQDTDKLQYDIFHTAFGKKDTVLFYIGDPKQSIYGWRKADIATYFRAREKVDHCYTMNINYRSSGRVVEALNKFFLPRKDFDTFYFKEEENRILYHDVDAAEEGNEKLLVLNGESVVPITITTHERKSDIPEAVGDQVWNLLVNTQYKISDKKNKKDRNIHPSDIGILVRSHYQAEEVKQALIQRNIPAVTVSNIPILQSKETEDLSYVLDAFIHHDSASVHRALMTVFTPFKADDIEKLTEEKTFNHFRKYEEKWETQGVYAALTAWISDFNIQAGLLSGTSGNKERTLTNLYHLLEVLHKTENQQRLNPVELIGWIKRKMEDKDSAEEETEQRIESDEDAVKITTIHKSKGLEYNIVMAPYLDFVPKNNGKPLTFRNKAGEYLTAKRAQVDEDILEQYRRQEEQENRRLLYVALTRAVYKCFIFKNMSSKSNPSTLYAFTESLAYDGDKIEKVPSVDTRKLAVYSPAKLQKQLPKVVPNFQLRENNWWKMSYSSLATHGAKSKKEAYIEGEDGYDRFIFRDLRKGAKTGDLLHHLLEKLHFTQTESWPETIRAALNQSYRVNQTSSEKYLLMLLHHVLDTPIATESDQIQLATLAEKNKLPEMEFDFPVNVFTTENLSKIRKQGVYVKPLGRSEGVINGFIDLFFQYNNKYYILDWKSNYLGPNIEDYGPDKLEDAMDENNYHLQYLLYTYAIKKYLHSRIGDAFNYERDFGGVIYLFLRGMRKGKNTGIFYTKPSKEQLAFLEDLFDGG